MKVRLFADLPILEREELFLEHMRRQTPTMTGNFYKDIEFVLDDSYTHAVAINKQHQEYLSPSKNNIGFLMEPPEIWSPKSEELLQIGKYYVPYDGLKEMLGGKYRQLPMQNFLFAKPLSSNTKPSEKTKKLSIVVSMLEATPFQRKRKEIVESLLKTDWPIDFYGRDFKPGMPDVRVKGPLDLLKKHLALNNYSFSLAFENNGHDGYLTEKFLDCIITNCIPVTNNPSVFKHYPKNSFLYLDFNSTLETIMGNIKDIFSIPITPFDSPILDSKYEVLYGQHCFAENIYKALNNII